MSTSLDLVRALNYDHHARMAQLKASGHDSAQIDELSYRTLLARVPNDRAPILELGSASGGQWPLLSEWLADGGMICGIDLYEPFVLEAQRRGLLIEVGFVENMHMFPDETFDLVCSRHVMEHLGDLDAGIKEILRVTAPGGYIAHVTPNMQHDNEPAHLNHLDASQWANLWQSYGVTLISAERHPFHGGEVHIVGMKQ
jgi:SAM-dependent methyltransferase